MRENLTSGSRWQGMETGLTIPRRHSLTLPPDRWDSSRFKEVILFPSIFPYNENSLRPPTGR